MRKWLLILLLAIPLIHAGLLRSPEPVDASGDVVLATGTVTLANTKLSLADTYAFFDFSTDMTPWIGEEIEICPATAASKSYCIRGLVSTVGTGETLGTSYAGTNNDFASAEPPGSAWTRSTGVTITGGKAEFSNVSSLGLSKTVNIGSISGVLVKSGIDCDAISGGTVKLSLSASAFTTVTSTGTNQSFYYTRALQYPDVNIYRNTGTVTATFDNIYANQVTTPSTTGHWIKKSAASTTDGDGWSQKSASFLANDSAGYYYRIIQSRPPGDPVASGTLTSSDVRLATVDGGAMLEISGMNLSDMTSETAVGLLSPTLWLRANDITDANGTLIETWADKSTNGYDATSAGDYRPKIIDSCVSDKKCLRFDGGDGMVVSAINKTTLPYKPITYFVVAKPTGDCQYAPLYVGRDQSGVPTGGGVSCYTSSEYFAYGNGGSFVSDSISHTNTWFIGSVVNDSSTSSNIYVNGVNKYSGSFTGTQTSEIAFMISNRVSYNNGSAKDIAEIIVFNTNLSETKRQQVERYLSSYYGIALTGPNSVPTSFSGNDAYTPPTANLQLHLKADSGCYTDAAKTTACTNDGDKAYTWADQSANGNDAVQATEDYRPLYKTSIVGSLPAIRFDGTDDSLVSSGTNVSQPATVYTVHVGSPSTLTMLFDNKASPRTRIYHQTTTMTINAGTSAVITQNSVSSRNVYSFLFNGTSSKQFQGGLLRGGTINIGTNAIGDPLVIGSQYNNAASLGGDIYEILVYNTAHDDATRTRIERYLAGKWGITTYQPTYAATSPARYMLALYDSAGKVATGWIGGPGAGETLGDEILTNGTMSSDEPPGTFWDRNTVWTISGGIASNSGTPAYLSKSGITTIGYLYKYSFEILSGGIFNLVVGGTAVKEGAGTGVHSGYINCDGAARTGWYLATSVASTVDNGSLKRVTEISKTGVHLHSTPNGYDRKMARKDSGFNPNGVTSYKIYQVGNSGYDLDLMLQEDMTQIIGNEGATIYLQQEGS